MSLQSSIGNMVAYVALLLLAYDMTHSAWAVSAVLLAESVPAIAFSPLCGALADRHSRRALVVTAEILRCASFVALAFAGSLTALLVLALVAGLGQALYQPASKSALPGLAGERADEAMAALVASWSAAVMVGPAVGAALLAVLSPESLLLVNAATFLVSAIVLSGLPIALPARTASASAADGSRSVAHGVRAARSIPGLTVLVGASGFATLAFSMMNVAEPLLARAELKTGATGFALLVCVFGIGSTIGALRGRANGATMLAALAGGGLALIATAVVPSLELAAATFLVTGIFAGAFMSSDQQLVARLTPDNVRGRVFGLKDALDSAAVCAAFVAGGLIASYADSRMVFAVSGAAALLVAIPATALLLRAGVVARSGKVSTAIAPRIGPLASSAARAHG